MVKTNQLHPARLDEVCRLVTDGTHDSPKLQSAGVPFIKGKHISAGFIDFDNCDFITEKDHKKAILRSKPEKGDILFSNIGSVGDAAYVGCNKEFSIKNVALFKPDHSVIESRYLYYLVIGPEFRGGLFSKRQGVAQPFFSLEMLRSHQVYYHKSIETQRKIAAILSAYDDLIENNLRRIKILEEMAQNLYREWFVNFRFPGHEKVKMVDSPLGKIPEGWEVSEFRNLFEIKYGKTLPKTEISNSGQYPVYGAGDIIGYYDRFLCPNKCALVTSRGNGSGTVWRTREAAFVTNNSLIILPQEKFSHWDYPYVELLLKHSNVMEAKTGSAQPQVTIENLNYVKAIVPSSEIVKKFCFFSTPIYEHVDLLFAKNTLLRRTRDLLLPKLISGEVDVSVLDISIQEADI